MAITKSELTKMNEASLAELAERLGLEINASTANKKTLLEVIGAKLEEQSRVAEVDNEENEGLVLDEGSTPPRKPMPTKRYKVIIHAQENDPSPFIKVCPNGKMYQIYRDVEVIIPEEVKHILDNAVMTVFTRVDGVMQGRDVRRYPFSVLEVL